MGIAIMSKVMALSKHKLSFIMMIGAIGLLMYCWIDNTLLREQVRVGENAQHLLELQRDSTKYYKTSNNKNVARVLTEVSEKKNMEIMLRNQREILADVGKLKNVQSYLAAEMQAKGKFSVPSPCPGSVHKTDTFIHTREAVIDFSDGYLKIKCNGAGDSLVCDYQYTDTLTAVTFVKRVGKWWQFWRWGQKESLTDVYFQNPAATPSGVKSIIRKER